MASVVAASTVGGIAESAALLLAVRVALALSSGDDPSTDLPFTGASLSSTASIVLAACCAVVSLLSHIVIAHLTSGVTSTVLASVRDVATTRYVEAGWSTQALQRDGALQETVTMLAFNTALLAHTLVGGAAQLVGLLMFILTALIVDPLITLVVVAAGVGIIVFLRPVNGRNDRAQRAFTAINSQYAEEVTRLTSTSMELRVFGVQEEARQEVGAFNDQARAKFRSARFWMTFGLGLYKDLAILLLVAAVAALSLGSSSEIAGIGVVVTLMVRSLSSAQAVNGAYQSSREGTANLDALRRRLLTLEEGAEQHGDQAIDAVHQIE
ncbi:MAG: hypothetical protein WKF60_13130, partial [Ilumatobacter sp.]